MERAQYNAAWSREPSRFLIEIGTDVLDEASRAALSNAAPEDDLFGEPSAQAVEPTIEDAEPAAPVPARAPKRAAGGAAVSVGDWVLHEQFGEGRVVGLQRSEKMTLATIALRSGGKRIFALEHAPLRKV
jgi:hypothetical protein